MSRDPGWSGSAALASPAWATKNRGPDPAHGSGGFGGLTAVALPRPGHRSPVDSAAGRRAPVRHEGADEESHCRLDRSLLNGGPVAGHPRSVNRGLGCRRSLRPPLARCQASYGGWRRERNAADPDALPQPSFRYAQLVPVPRSFSNGGQSRQLNKLDCGSGLRTDSAVDDGVNQ
jgi:hypothetical protein